MTPHVVFYILILGTAGKLWHILLVEMEEFQEIKSNGQVLFQGSTGIVPANSLLDKTHHMAELNFKGQENTFGSMMGGALK